MCALRPGVPGLSETIRVRSILGRFLEHSRVFRFVARRRRRSSSSAAPTLMHRNLDRRVEALVEIRDPEVRASLQRLLALAVDPGDVGLGRSTSTGTWIRDVTDEPTASRCATTSRRCCARRQHAPPRHAAD